MRRLLPTLAVTVAATVGLTATGCGDDESADKPATTTGTPAATGGASTRAATLRASLTALLEDHVYLTGFAIGQRVSDGLESPDYTAAAAALDKNSVALGDVVGSVYGSDVGARFLTLWRKHITLFVDYTKGKLAKDKAGSAKARADLDAYRETFGAFIARANPKLATATVAGALKPHIAGTLRTIDAAVAPSPAIADRLHAAAGDMPAIARVLAAGIAEQFPAKFSGSPNAAASELRAALTGLLSDHAYLTMLSISAGVRDGFGSAAYKKGLAAVEESSVALSEVFSSVYGEDFGNQFLGLWRKQVASFISYAKAKAAKSRSAAEAVLADLDGFRQDLGGFISNANARLTTDAVAEELEPHVESMTAAIRADVVGSPKTFDLIRKAAAVLPDTAELLADGIAAQHPETFPSS